MKKIILGISLAGLVMSCQKVQEGDNKGVLRMTDDDRGAEGFPYDPEAQGHRGTQPERTAQASPMAASIAADSLRTATVQEVSLKTDSAKSTGTATNP